MSSYTETEPLRAMVLDDNNAVRQVLTAGLAQYGIDVAGAGNVQEALACITAHSPDVAVLDMFLPGSSGLEVARSLRSDGRTNATVIIALSGDSSVEYRERATASGCDAYLAKPCTIEQLVDLIKTVLTAKSIEYGFRDS